MWERLLSRFAIACEWVRVARLYRNADYEAFLEALEVFSQLQALSPYQLALKANALLMIGRYKEALAIFSMLSAVDGFDRDRRYIALYARAMISDINGDEGGFARNAAAASDIRPRQIIRRNLPL